MMGEMEAQKTTQVALTIQEDQKVTGARTTQRSLTKIFFKSIQMMRTEIPAQKWRTYWTIERLRLLNHPAEEALKHLTSTAQAPLLPTTVKF